LISDRIAFVILTWNAEKYFVSCLESVLALPADKLHIYIVDNGSTDGTPALLDIYQKKDPALISATYLSKNEGTTKSRNYALKMIPKETKWICILDSDTVVNAAAMETLIESLVDQPQALLAAPRMWKPGNEEQLSCKHFPNLAIKLLKGNPFSYLQKIGLKKESYAFFPDTNREGNPPVSQNKEVYEVDYAISACWMLKYEALEKVGLLDEHYFYAPEDVDYCAMVWENGYKVLFVSGASIYHNTQRLSHKRVISDVNRAHLNGLIYYFRKHDYLFSQKIRK